MIMEANPLQAHWVTWTNGQQCDYVELTPSRLIVWSSSRGEICWQSEARPENDIAHMRLRNDGKLVLEDKGGKDVMIVEGEDVDLHSG